MSDISRPTPAATVCPDCRTLITANADDRRKHREWHADLAAKHRGVQKRITELAEIASRAAAAVGDLRRDIDNVEIPEPVEPMRIEEWPADEYEPEQQSQYLDDDEYDDQQAATRADAEAAFANVPPAIDRDDDGYFTPRPA